MALSIRPGTPADTPIVVDFNLRMALETEHKMLDRALLERGVHAVLSDPAKGRYLIAEVDSIVAGQMMLTYEWSDWRNGMFWWIQSVYVREDQRGKGIYSALHSHVTAMAKKDGGVCGLRLYVEKDNDRAKRTYEKLGMTRTEYELYEIEVGR